MLTAVLALVFCGCVAPRAKGVYHTVGKGETLWRISHAYGVDVEKVARANKIKDPTEIAAGNRLFIPGAGKRLKVVPYEEEKEGLYKKRSAPSKTSIKPEKGLFQWPVAGTIVKRFGAYNGIRNDGIDIAAEAGAPVKAAAGGVVVFVDDDMRGYGNIVIIKHKDDFYTVYSHNRRHLVKKGEKVEKGDAIAAAAVPREGLLHFEVRKGLVVIDPLFYLP